MIPSEVTFVQFMAVTYGFTLAFAAFGALFVYLDRIGYAQGIERYGYAVMGRAAGVGLIVSLLARLIPASDTLTLGGSNSVWVLPLGFFVCAYVFLPVIFALSGWGFDVFHGGEPT